MKMICWYIQGTKYDGLVFNPSRKLVVDCYADADSAGLWGHKKPQDPICARSKTVFLVNFANHPLLWVSKIQTEISISTLHYDYVALSHFIREILSLKSLTEEVIDNLVIESEKLKFVSSSTVYKNDNRAIVVAKTPMMTHTTRFD